MIQQLGCKKLQIEEIFMLDDKYYLSTLEPIYGFIFLFKYDNRSTSTFYPEVSAESVPEVFFAKQVKNKIID